jgi:hypothetical protein
MICFGCRAEGHIEANCPNAAIDDGRPPWCGFCDEKTRLIDHGDSVSRCQQCHPAARKQLRQCRKCPHCHVTVYEWDQAPCGSHAGPSAPDRRPDRETIRGVIAAEYEPKDAA